ncbi:hypothetical protein [Bradyrhizobium aeschynomenes]|nr:hypothetical protein [Bradyrhizobium aeschynomenes]
MSVFRKHASRENTIPGEDDMTLLIQRACCCGPRISGGLSQNCHM